MGSTRECPNICQLCNTIAVIPSHWEHATRDTRPEKVQTCKTEILRACNERGSGRLTRKKTASWELKSQVRFSSPNGLFPHQTEESFMPGCTGKALKAVVFGQWTSLVKFTTELGVLFRTKKMLLKINFCSFWWWAKMGRKHIKPLHGWQGGFPDPPG